MIRTVLALIVLVAAMGVVGEMDYADACKADAKCKYEGWAD